MSTISILNAKVAFLKISPHAWDEIIPHGPKVSPSLVEYMVAGLVRDIAKRVKDLNIKTKLMDIGKELAIFGSQKLIQGWEMGDDICPSWPIPPWPWWKDLEQEEVEPAPWVVDSVEQVVLADFLISLADITKHSDIKTALKDMSQAIIKETSHCLADDFENAI